jgi:hypothetical protein
MSIFGLFTPDEIAQALREIGYIVTPPPEKEHDTLCLLRWTNDLVHSCALEDGHESEHICPCGARRER